MSIAKLVKELSNGSDMVTVKTMRAEFAKAGWSRKEADEMLIAADAAGVVKLSVADHGAPQKEGIMLGGRIAGLVVALVNW
jgi:hypothetical protein